MEHGLLTVLRIVTNKLKTLLSNAHVVNRTLSDNIDGAQTKTLEAEIMVSKLEACLQRLSSDLNNYFRLNTEPATDEISEITTVQLEAEEMLCELKIRTKGKLQASGSGSKKEERLVSGKLPKLDLPQFNGEIVKWHTFWDQFSSNIHNRNLPDVDKLLYLKASLKGDAKKIIEGLDTTNKNYEIALQTLKERFGKRTHIVDAHYSALYKVKTADNTVIDCRRALDEIERHLQVLESLGEDVNHNHLRFLVTEKFPQDIIYEMRMKTVEESIEEMRKHLKLIITTREEAYRLSQENNPQRIDDFTTETLHTVDRSQRTGPTKQGRGRNNERQEFKTNPRRSQRNFPQDRDSRYLSKREFTPNKATTFDERDRNGDGVPRKRMKMHCIFCNEDHFNDECDKFKTVHERMSLLKDRCISCFRKGHQMKECRIKRICQHCKVFGKHNRALCPQKFVIKTNTLHTNEGGPTILQTAIVTASDGIHSSKGLPCRALMDSGSQRTYITQRVAKELDLQVEEESKLTVFTFGSKSPQEIDSPIVKVMLKTRTGKLISLTANVVPMISHGVPYPTQDFIKWKDNSELADDGSLSDQIDILIGNDYYFSLISSEKIKIQENLYLVRSDLGWILSGKPDSKSDNDLSVVTYFQSCVEVKLNRPDLPLSDGYLKNLWELESIGITDSPKDSREGEAVRTFNETTEFIDNRYHVSWPWIEYPSALSTNLGLAYGRLVTLLRRLDCETLSSYDETLKEQIKNNVVEIVPNIRERPNEHPVHYLPHHGVKQPGKPVRIVYDASSKTKDSKSLNQYLYCGPILLEDLTGLLIRFRCYAIGICADVEKAFLQLALKETDRDVTRFLWLKDIRKPATEDNILHLRFCRVPFGVISSPFLLNATIKMHLGKSGKEHIKELTQNIYVDNVISGARSVKEAMRLYKDAKETFNEISMNLREWSSNSKGVMKQMPDACEDQEVKVLGLKWSLEEDTLQLRHKGADDKSKTKGDVLRVIASIYDPCGCAAPALLPAKLFIQDLWKQKIKWDTHFSEDLNNTWSKIRQDLNGIKEISLPRCYFQNMEKEECQLHCFTDSSTKAYAAVVYLVNDNEISFVIGKSRLVPIKDQDYLKIPRLELLGVLIGCRLVKYVLQFLRLKVTKQVLWTDSQIVIDWYNSDKLLTPFVAKRIEEIRRNKDLIVKYVPSELNPPM